MTQPTLFNISPDAPPGFRYSPDFISEDEELFLIENIQQLTLEPYEFGEYTAKRNILEFNKEEGFPPFIGMFVVRAAKFANVPKESIEHVLFTEYKPGTPIGWHRDMPPYNDVIGISLNSSCQFRLRKEDGESWERKTIILEPRSIYVMSGPSRSVWQHSIPPVEKLRYSITMRTIR